MTRETFNKEFVTGLKTNLEAAPPSTGKLSKADVLRELAPTLKDLRDNKGYTLEALVELLAEKGLNVKVSTIQGALKKKGTAKKKEKAPTAPPTATSPQTTPTPPAASAPTVAATQDGIKPGDLMVLGAKTRKTA